MRVLKLLFIVAAASKIHKFSEDLITFREKENNNDMYRLETTAEIHCKATAMTFWGIQDDLREKVSAQPEEICAVTDDGNKNGLVGNMFWVPQPEVPTDGRSRIDFGLSAVKKSEGLIFTR